MTSMLRGLWARPWSEAGKPPSFTAVVFMSLTSEQFVSKILMAASGQRILPASRSLLPCHRVIELLCSGHDQIFSPGFSFNFFCPVQQPHLYLFLQTLHQKYIHDTMNCFLPSAVVMSPMTLEPLILVDPTLPFDCHGDIFPSSPPRLLLSV